MKEKIEQLFQLIKYLKDHPEELAAYYDEVRKHNSEDGEEQYYINRFLDVMKE